MMRKGWTKKRGSLAKSPQAVVVQAYNIAHTLRDMLAMMPDADLAAAKRTAYELEDLLWQAVDERR